MKAEKIISEWLKGISDDPDDLAKKIIKDLEINNLVITEKVNKYKECKCKEGKSGRTVNEDWEQVCDRCGGI